MSDPDDYLGAERRNSDRRTVEHRLDVAEERLRAHKAVADAVAREQEAQNLAIRALQDWRAEMTVYFRQLKWTLVTAAAALLVGLVNVVLLVGVHP